MTTRTVIGIYIARDHGEETFLVQEVHAVPGKGIEGDRYFGDLQHQGVLKKNDRELTLIEAEAIEAMIADDGINISFDKCRRNIITRGVKLNNLVEHHFMVGDVKLRGIRLCEPCQYLANRTNPRVLSSMIHRGGLRAQILSEGIIHINDIITSLE
jgi:MOSC domain-containing protein YiiM